MVVSNSIIRRDDGDQDLPGLILGLVVEIVEMAGVARSMRWLSAMVAFRRGAEWDDATEDEQAAILKAVTGSVDWLPRDQFRVFRNVKGLDEQSGHDEDNAGRRRGATVIVSLTKHPDVTTEQDALRLLRPKVQLGDKVTRGKVAEWAAAVTLSEEGGRLQAIDVETERRALRSLDHLRDWDLHIWDKAGKRVLALIEMKNLIGLAVRLSEFKGLAGRITEADAWGIPAIVVVPKATKKFCREVRELGGVVVEISCYLVSEESHRDRLETLGMPWPVAIGSRMPSDFGGVDHVGLADGPREMLVSAVARELALSEQLGWDGFGGRLQDEPPRRLSDEERADLRAETRLVLNPKERVAVRGYVADLSSLRRLEEFDVLDRAGLGVREAADRMGVDAKTLYRDAERWDRSLRSADEAEADHHIDQDALQELDRMGAVGWSQNGDRAAPEPPGGPPGGAGGVDAVGVGTRAVRSPYGESLV